VDLTGRVVVVTRAQAQASALADLLEAEGAEPLVLPTIEIREPDDWEPVDAAAGDLRRGRYTWVLFTSVNGVEGFLGRLDGPESVLAHAKVAAVGSATASLLRSRGVGVDLVATTYTGADLATELGPGDGEVLLPRAAVVPPHMTKILRAAGWKPHDVAVYKTVPADTTGEPAKKVLAGGFDIVTFASASAARGFAGMAGDLASLGLGRDDPPGRLVACIGPSSAEACTEAGMRVDIEAAEHTTAGLIAALKAHPA
jgi:uroporphyrinogen III methyltransferase/synthase